MTEESLSFIEMNQSDSEVDPVESIMVAFKSYLFGPINAVQERRNFNLREQVIASHLCGKKIHNLSFEIVVLSIQKKLIKIVFF